MAIEAVMEDEQVEATPEPEAELPETTEEPKDDQTDEEPREGGTEAKKETIEDIAREIGWHHGGTDKFGNTVDAATFIKRSKDIQETLSSHLKDNRTKMERMEKGFDDLRNHFEKVSKAQIAKQQKEIDRLRKEKREAIEEGDADRVDEIESEMLDKYNSMEMDTPRQTAPQPDPSHVEAFDKWRSQHDWYGVKGSGGDPDMTAYADKMANLPEYDALPYERKLTAVTELVKKAFPEKFQKQQPKTPTVNPVEGARGTGAKRQFTERDLNPEQLQTAKTFEKLGVLKMKDYIKQLAEIGEIG